MGTENRHGTIKIPDWAVGLPSGRPTVGFKTKKEAERFMHKR